MVAIESQHENRSDSMFSGICEPKLGGVPNPVFRRFLEMGAILGLKAKIKMTHT
jgi:hypothetical protein